MDAGFRAMHNLEQGTVPQKFETVFKVKWSRSSYYTHQEVWSTLNSETLAYAVQCGRGEGGSWPALVKMYGKPKTR